ncbi:MAG: hypothetical protein R3F39_08750 [Myxococcota bacterium]
MARAPSKVISRIDVDTRLGAGQAANSDPLLRPVEDLAPTSSDANAPNHEWVADPGYEFSPVAPTLAEMVAEAEASGSGSILISMASEPSLDGDGLAALIRLYGRCMVNPGRRLYLRHVSAELRREMARIGIEGLIPILD